MRAFSPFPLFGCPDDAQSALALRGEPSRPCPHPGLSTTDSRESSPEYGKRRVICAACGFYITREDFAVHKNGAHRHTFCNPNGLVFEIALFSHAPGCLILGPPSLEFTWFPGYAWGIACCGGCVGHLGWRYGSVSGDVFFGIVADRITMETENSAGM